MFFVQVNIEPVVHVYSNDTDVFVILVSCLHQLNCNSMCLNLSTKELIDLTLTASSLGDKKAKGLTGFHALTGSDIVEKFTSKSKEAWTKHFLQADSKILNSFCRYSQEHFGENFEAIKRFVVRSYVPRSSKITDFAEAWWWLNFKNAEGLAKKVKIENRKISTWARYLPQKGHFFNVACVQARIWHEATKACINHADPQEYRWKPSDECFIAIATEDDIVPELLLTVCGCKSSNSATRSWKSSLNGIPCSDLCSCRHKFCENADPKEILENDSSDEEDDTNHKEWENDE